MPRPVRFWKPDRSPRTPAPHAGSTILVHPLQPYGENHYCHIVCNPLYAAYFTKKRKDRQTILVMLRDSNDREYVLNEQAMLLLEVLNLSRVKRELLQNLVSEAVYSDSEFFHLLESHDLALGPTQKRQVLDAAAISAYHLQQDWPIIALLLADSAPEFIAALLALCWGCMKDAATRY